MIKDILLRLIFGAALVAGGTRLSGIEPLEIFDWIFPYKKLEKLTHKLILEPWPNPDIFQNEPSEFFD